MAKNKSFYSCDSVTHQGKSNTWFTPQPIVNGCGEFDLDPCTQSFRPFDTAKNHYEFDNGQDGLKLPWAGKIWLNPPYGKNTGLWLDKLADHGNGIALVFSALETSGGQKHLEQCTKIHFLKGRISFIDKLKNKRNNAGKGSILICYGDHEISLPGISMVSEDFKLELEKFKRISDACS